MSADDAYTRMRRGIPARNLYRWMPILAIFISIKSSMSPLLMNQSIYLLLTTAMETDQAAEESRMLSEHHY